MQTSQIFHPDNGGAEALVDKWIAANIQYVHMPTNGNFAQQKNLPQTASTTSALCQLTIDTFLADLPPEERAAHAAFVSLDSDKALRAFHAPQNHPEQTGLSQEARAGNIVDIVRERMGLVTGSVDGLLYDMEDDAGIKRAVQLWDLQKLAAENNIHFVSTGKLGPYGLPGQAPLEFAELFEHVSICPFPADTHEQPTFLDRANQHARNSGAPVIGMPQGKLVNLFDVSRLNGGKDAGGTAIEIDMPPSLSNKGMPYLHAALPHAEY